MRWSWRVGEYWSPTCGTSDVTWQADKLSLVRVRYDDGTDTDTGPIRSFFVSIILYCTVLDWIGLDWTDHFLPIIIPFRI